LKLGIAGLPEEDLNLICLQSHAAIEFLHHKEILIYGGTGFIGTWLTAALLHADQQFNLKIKIKVITRNQSKAINKFGVHKSNIQFHQYDLALMEPSNNLTADVIFIASTPTNTSTGSLNTQDLVQASRNVVSHATRVRSRILGKPLIIHLSSGAVFGKQSMDYLFRNEFDAVDKYSEEPYCQAKLVIENGLISAHAQGAIDYQTPRLFAFLGPGLPLNLHFAIGNFVFDGMQKRKILVRGNPMTRRSYLYPTDLIEVLFQTLLLKEPVSFNIGSNTGITISDLAQKISSLTSNLGVTFLSPESYPSNYVPSTVNMNKNIKKNSYLDLDTSLEKWINWLKTTKNGAMEA
jgi:nucleoside-diphosphate-sugar epimerase